MKDRKRILILDDYLPLLEACIASLRKEFDVMGLNSDAGDLGRFVRIFHPDVLVLDLGVLQHCALQTGETIKRENPSIHLIYFTADESRAVAIESFRRGASAYVIKNSGITELRKAIHLALDGHFYASPGIHFDIPPKFAPDLPGIHPVPNAVRQEIQPN